MPKSISKVAIIKVKSATIAFLCSRLFLRRVTVIFELLGLKKPAFWRLFTQMTANFVRLVFKQSVTYTFKGVVTAWSRF